MRYALGWLLIIGLFLAPGCAKKQQADNQDMKPNLDRELSDDFLKIKRPRPLTQQEKAALASKSDIPFNLDVRETEEVQMFLTYFTQDKRDTMERWLERAAPHLPYIRAVLATYKLPPDIIALPFIESGYNSMAYSHAGAGGMWQFMPATGKRFGLNVDWWEDERRNPYLSTVAAAKYLSELHAMFNDWNLALAAYNCGEGKMSRVINQSGRNDFFDIAKHPTLLKQETRHYVPKFLAVLKIFKNLDALGFKPVKWDAGQVLEEVSVPGGTDLAALAEACSMGWEEFHKYNSGFRRQVSPPDRQCPVYVPVERKEKALAYLKDPSSAPNRGIRAYTASGADSWWNISKRSGVPIAALRQMNPSVGDAVVPGQLVYVPLDSSAQDIALAGFEDPIAKPATAKALSYKVKRGESLASLAKNHGVSQADILKANGLKNAGQVTAGKTITIPGKAAPEPAPSVQAQQGAQAKSMSTVEKTVEVKKGLTLAAVAAANKVDVKALMAANGMKSEKELKAGMKLKVPGAQAQSPAAQPQAAAPVPVPAAAPVPAAQPSKGRNLKELAGKDAKASNAQAHSAPAPSKDAKGTAKPEATQDQKKPGAPIQYSVGSGDTVWSIARKFNVDPNALLAWNNLNKSSHLKPGDRLKINPQ